MLIALMGKSGSGKTLISTLFKDLNPNIQIIDVDKIGHMSHSDSHVKNKLREYFGDEIFNLDDGGVNRKALASIVFRDKAKMQLLYDATYDFMVRQIDEKISQSDIVILDYALLPLTKYFALSDVKILVEASYEKRCERAQQRDNITREKYDARDANSLDYMAYSFDYILENNGDIEALRKEIGEIYDKSIVSRLV